MQPRKRGKTLAPVLAIMLAVAGCASEPTGAETPDARPAFDGGVGTLGSGNKADTTQASATATQGEGAGVGTFGSGN